MQRSIRISGAVGISLLLLTGCASNTQSQTKKTKLASKSKVQNSSTSLSTATDTNSNDSVNKSQTQTFTAEQQIQDIYRALQDIPKTPKQYVNAYLQAISTRSGSLARGYLAPSIRNQIPARVIGPSDWIRKWTITPTSSSNGTYHFNVVAYQYVIPTTQNEKGTWIEAFNAKISVQSEDTSDHNHGPWIVTSQQITFRKYLNF